MRCLRSACSILIGLLAPVLALAGDPEPLVNNRWFLNVGGYLTDFSTDASVGTGGVVGTTFRAEDELGIQSDQSLFRFEGSYRFGKRQEIGFGYWDASRSGENLLNERIEFQGVEYDVGVLIRSDVDSSWIRADWRYSMLQTDRGAAGIAAGISAYDFDFVLEGVGSISDGMGGVITENVRSEEGVLAPAPTLGMFIRYAILPRLLFRANANVFKLRSGDYEATLTESLLAIDWYFTRHFGVGLGALSTRIDFKITDSEPASIDYRQSGLAAYFTGTF